MSIKIKRAVQQLNTVRKSITEAEDLLDSLNATERKLSTESIPELLFEEGVESLVTDDGTTIQTKITYQGSLKADKQEEAISLLVKHGQGPNVNKTVIVKDSLDDTGSSAVCKQAEDLLKAANIDYYVKYDIHHMTLKSALKELLEDNSITLEQAKDVFGVFQQIETEVKEKGKKSWKKQYKKK